MTSTLLLSTLKMNTQNQFAEPTSPLEARIRLQRLGAEVEDIAIQLNIVNADPQVAQSKVPGWHSRAKMSMRAKKREISLLKEYLLESSRQDPVNIISNLIKTVSEICNNAKSDIHITEHGQLVIEDAKEYLKLHRAL